MNQSKIPHSITILAFLLLSAWLRLAPGAQAADWPGRKSDFHGLDDPAPIVEFVVRHTLP